eukprot:1146501-Pelagomonas_calceolata.AAC.2
MQLATLVLNVVPYLLRNERHEHEGKKEIEVGVRGNQDSISLAGGEMRTGRGLLPRAVAEGFSDHPAGNIIELSCHAGLGSMWSALSRCRSGSLITCWMHCHAYLHNNPPQYYATCWGALLCLPARSRARGSKQDNGIREGSEKLFIIRRERPGAVSLLTRASFP